MFRAYLYCRCFFDRPDFQNANKKRLWNTNIHKVERHKGRGPFSVLGSVQRLIGTERATGDKRGEVNSPESEKTRVRLILGFRAPPDSSSRLPHPVVARSSFFCPLFLPLFFPFFWIPRSQNKLGIQRESVSETPKNQQESRRSGRGGRGITVRMHQSSRVSFHTN